MSASSKNIPSTYAELLAAFDSRLGSHGDDERLLQEVEVAMKTLLSGGAGREADIRSVLRKRLADGKLRNESFQLVQNMLDQILGEHAAAATAANDEPDEFVITTVIPDDSGGSNTGGNRLQVGSVLRDRFLLQEKVSGSSLGDVYKALDRRLAESGGEQPAVAIRVLTAQLARNSKALRALQQEAAKWRCLSHPNIVGFIDLDREDEVYFIVMEWLEGEPLASRLDGHSGNSLDPDAAFDIVGQIGRALDYAHRCGVVHADVKPGNIIITPSGQAKLLDFGVARIRQKKHEGEPDFDPGVLDAKTPAYSSMQVLTGEDPVPADDVFSLACLLYRLLAGYRVFGPRNAAEAAADGMEPQRLQGLSDSQWSALRKALAYSRVSRFASPSAFLKALAAGSADTEVSVEVDFDNDEEPQSRSPWRMVALLLLAGGLAAVAMTDRIAALIEPPQETAVAQLSTPPVSETPSGERGVPLQPGKETAADPGPQSVAAESPEPAVAQDRKSALQVEADVYVPIDFSSLPPPDLRLDLGAGGSQPGEAALTIREDSAAAIVDLVRAGDLSRPLTVHIGEVSYSGNRSPLQSGQYTIEAGGVVSFAAGQARARTSIAMQSDPLREADRQVSLQLRDVDAAEAELGSINLRLEDDDQRRFEAGLQPDTVAFAVSQVSVQERDPAVQIDVLRFKPGNTALEVAYTLRDVTAANGEDYFAPADTTISFAPGQRSARILIPLVQDSDAESDEAFLVELTSGAQQANANIFLRIAVMIRDDDS